MTTRTLERHEKIDPVFPPLVGKAARIAIIVFTLIAVLNDGTELRVGRTYTAAIRARLARRA